MSIFDKLNDKYKESKARKRRKARAMWPWLILAFVSFFWPGITGSSEHAGLALLLSVLNIVIAFIMIIVTN